MNILLNSVIPTISQNTPIKTLIKPLQNTKYGLYLALLKSTMRIPKEWQGKYIFFFNTGYQIERFNKKNYFCNIMEIFQKYGFIKAHKDTLHQGKRYVSNTEANRTGNLMPNAPN